MLYLDANKTHEENIEMVIINGLSFMEDSDFDCCNQDFGVKVESGIPFNWAHKARNKIPNAYLYFQELTVSGRVDFYLNSFADTAIEVMLNAIQTIQKRTPQSQDIDKHLKRFHPDKYAWKRYVLFNLTKKGVSPVLPSDISAHDKMYTFVRSTNTLYRGEALIKKSAIPNLSGGSRSFSTALLRIELNFFHFPCRNFL